MVIKLFQWSNFLRIHKPYKQLSFQMIQPHRHSPPNLKHQPKILEEIKQDPHFLQPNQPGKRYKNNHNQTIQEIPFSMKEDANGNTLISTKKEYMKIIPYPETPSATAITPPAQLLTKKASSPPVSAFKHTRKVRKLSTGNEHFISSSQRLEKYCSPHSPCQGVE